MLHGAMGARLRRRPEPAHTEILSHYQRNTDSVNDRYRGSGGGQAVLTLQQAVDTANAGLANGTFFSYVRLSPRPQAGCFVYGPRVLGSAAVSGPVARRLASRPSPSTTAPTG